MPGKHRVHFNESKNTFHSPAPVPSPLLSLSGSSTTPSLGPLTPPLLAYSGLPGPSPYAPQQVHRSSHSRSKSYPSAAAPRAHNLLTFSSAPPLIYDVSLHPSTLATHQHSLSSAGLSEPAIYPPQAALTLTTPHLPWSIPVSASNGHHVTISDLLSALYRSLRTGATESEYATLGTPHLMRMVSASYEQRCERARTQGRRAYEDEKRLGVKRVDFLMGYTRFMGVSPTQEGAGLWQVHIS